MGAQWSMKNPYSTVLSSKEILNGPGARKETRHIVIDLGDSGIDYRVGDAIGIIPENPHDLVMELIEELGFSGDDIVETHNGEGTLYDALKRDFEVHRLNKKFVKAMPELLAEKRSTIEARIVHRVRISVDGEHEVEWLWSGEDDDYPAGYLNGEDFDPSARAAEIASTNESLEDYIWSRDFVDALREFPSLRFEQPVDFLRYLDKLKGRLYSIASSHDSHPGEVQLTIAIVRYEHHERKRAGLCTGFLADEAQLNETNFGIYMAPTRSFLLPADGSTDIIMVGPGTGIAPFRAFLEQREFDGSSGRSWLIFGDQHEATEFYYREQIEGWLESGVLHRFTTAWSRDQAEKIYVQNRMLEHAQEIWEWIDDGACFYVCGDKNYMAKDVHAALIKICSENGGMGDEAAHHFVQQQLMKVEKRYLRDVY